MATQKGSGLVSRAVREALSTLVSPTLCEQLINRSLASHGLSAVPESGTEIGEWLEGPLRGEVETTVGPDAADLMMMQLGPIAAYAAFSQPSVPQRAASPEQRARKMTPPRMASEPNDLDDRRTDLRFDVSAEPVWTPASVPPASATSQRKSAASDAFSSDPPTGTFNAPKARPIARPPAPSFLSSRRPSEPPVRTLPPAQRISDVPPERFSRGLTARPAPLAPLNDEAVSESKVLPLVLTATNNRLALNELRRYLAKAASVVHVPDLVGLLDALEEPGVVEPIVLIDCHSPTVHISSVSAIGEDLPRGTTVVLWGVDDSTWAQIDRERSPACRWLRCSSEATTDDVGSLCSMLLG